ncbi:unnamed protein product [Arctogadus glacialis]
MVRTSETVGRGVESAGEKEKPKPRARQESEQGEDAEDRPRERGSQGGVFSFDLHLTSPTETRTTSRIPEVGQDREERQGEGTVTHSGEYSFETYHSVHGQGGGRGIAYGTGCDATISGSRVEGERTGKGPRSPREREAVWEGRAEAPERRWSAVCGRMEPLPPGCRRRPFTLRTSMQSLNARQIDGRTRADSEGSGLRLREQPIRRQCVSGQPSLGSHLAPGPGRCSRPGSTPAGENG